MKIGYFWLQEFVPKEIYEHFGAKSLALIDARIIESANALREYINRPLFGNTWYFSKRNGFNYRGYRQPTLRQDPKTGTKFAFFSQHYFGQALDLHSDRMSAEEIRAIIMSKRHLFPDIRRLERAVSWVHFDLLETGVEDIVEFGREDEV